MPLARRPEPRVVEELGLLRRILAETSSSAGGGPSKECGGQMLKGAQMLGELWLTAWQHAPPDRYLEGQLAKRKAAAAKAPAGNEESGK